MSSKDVLRKRLQKQYSAESLPSPRDRLKPTTNPRIPYKPKYRPGVQIGVTLLGFLVAGFAGYSYTSLTAKPIGATNLDVPEDASDRYDKIASKFDSEVGMNEFFMGMNWLRSWLVQTAKGNVLEVSVGTGRNSSYYDVKKCESICMLDQSTEMIDIARRKFKTAYPSYRSCRFITQSAHDPIVSPPGGYDTVVQTMGICSTANPTKLLNHLGSITKLTSGRVLLLEHGRSHYDWLNRILDKGAPGHADKFGCWWNKDIGKIVGDSELEVISVKRYHLGTTWVVELKPKKPETFAAADSKPLQKRSQIPWA